ncbi:carboxypeptidase M32 [Chloroflexia bacterium SDU3-3]|nr:carboxypeptidase M32 [Chloroflexia bacterium SDU3-3]
MEPKLQELRRRLGEVADLQNAAAVLNWDQATYMPPGGAEARGRQISLLAQLAHERLTDEQLGTLLEELAPYAASLPGDADDRRLIEVAKRNFDRAVQVPSSFVAEFSSHSAALYDTWTRARPANDFSMVRAGLEKTLELSRRYASFFPGYEHIADPLIDLSDYGMKASSVRATFADLRAQLVPIVQAITAQPPADESCTLQFFPEAQQLAFGEQVIRAYGYDFERGRQDKTHHPFMTSFSIGDIRITTRVQERDLRDALFSTLHEAGHAMYEQGINPAYEASPLAGGASSGVHESQSRLWENLVGRSRAFWVYWYPRLQAVFPEQLGGVSLETFYRAVNKVERSLIRTDADEVTYNLHVMMRFDFELQLLEGKLSVRDLPEAWRERFKADIGIPVPDDRMGVLQDVHWYGGYIGGVFQGYTLGNILSAQFYEAARAAHPEIDTQMEAGSYQALHGWLKDNIYQHGAKYTAAELVQRVTGGPLSIDPYIRYLRGKYGEIYEL